MANFKILYPESIEEMTDFLINYREEAKILAGGTDLLVNIRSGKASYKYIISLKNVKELNSGIENYDDKILIGPLTTMNDIYRNKKLQKYFHALCSAAYTLGSQQIRNQATLAGNICNASPAAETATPLLIYDATVNIKEPGGYKEIPINEFFRGPGKTVLKNDEFVTGVSLPIPKVPEKSIYRRLSRRNGVDLAIVNMSMSVDESENIKLAYGSLGPVPFRAYKVEEPAKQYIDNKINRNDLYKEIENSISPISDLRSSREYKTEMIKMLTLKTIGELLKKGEY